MAGEKEQKGSYDLGLLFVTFALMGIGLVMLYSSSSIMAQQRFGDSMYFVKKQILFSLIGLAVLIVSKNLPYVVYRRLVYVILGVSLLSLILVLLPQIGHRVGGARRWLRLGSLSVQPAEFAKLTLIIYISYSLAKKKERVQEFSVGLKPGYLIVVHSGLQGLRRSVTDGGQPDLRDPGHVARMPVAHAPDADDANTYDVHCISFA